MKIVKGDIVNLIHSGEYDVVVHGCNCMCKMGAGIAKTLSSTYPEVSKADLRTKKGDRNKLGNYSCAVIAAKVNLPLVIINAYTQYHWAYPEVKVDYQAVESVFGLIAKHFQGKRILYPKIGAGLAGGDWDIISDIINEKLESENHTLVEWVS